MRLLSTEEAGAAVMAAVERVLAGGLRTPDMDGGASTEEMGKAICRGDLA